MSRSVPSGFEDIPPVSAPAPHASAFAHCDPDVTGPVIDAAVDFEGVALALVLVAVVDFAGVALALVLVAVVVDFAGVALVLVLVAVVVDFAGVALDPK